VGGGSLDGTRYDEDIASGVEKYTAKWTSLEQKADGQCPTEGDAASIQSFLDACVVSAEEALGGAELPLDVLTCNEDLDTGHRRLRWDRQDCFPRPPQRSRQWRRELLCRPLRLAAAERRRPRHARRCFAAFRGRRRNGCLAAFPWGSAVFGRVVQE